MKRAFTHSGVFHADDVFSTALLKILYPNILIERGNQIPDKYDGIIFDIGGGEFDHHKKNRRVRDNGVIYGAFGLLWEKYGTQVLEQEDAQNFDEEFVQVLDNTDNTGISNILSSVISDFNPSWNETEISFDIAFQNAVAIAKSILKRKFQRIQSKRKAYYHVKTLLEKNQGNILILPQALPWKDALKESEIEYVIYPSLRRGYMVQAVLIDENTLKRPFPKEWRGKKQEQLKLLTKIDTLTFCHMSGFLCATDTLEDAKKTAELSQNWS